jgi:hypothetical protein
LKAQVNSIKVVFVMYVNYCKSVKCIVIAPGAENAIDRVRDRPK